LYFHEPDILSEPNNFRLLGFWLERKSCGTYGGGVYFPAYQLDGYESLWDMRPRGHAYEGAESTGKFGTLFLQFWPVPP